MPLSPEPATADFRGQLVFLGTGTSTGVPMIGCRCPVCSSENPRNHRLRCSLLLGLPEGNLLIDTTPDLRMQLLREDAGIIHSVLYTHEHVDHVYGLDDLRLFPYYLGHPIPLYCEPKVEDRIRTSFDYAFIPGRSYGKMSVPQLDLRSIGTEPFQLLGAVVQPIRLLHGRTKVLGFRFGDLAYCTDTNHIPPESWPLLQGLEVLILDCLRPQPHATHFGLDEALEVARRSGARRTLFTHVSHELEHEVTQATLPPGVEMAYDGLRVPLS